MIDSLYDTFKRWSESGSVYIISDLHFEDENRRKMDENWISTDEQKEILKKTAHKGDTLIILGDVGDKSCLKSIWKNGKKPHIVLLLGNHDAPGEFHGDPFFDEVYEGPLFISEKILLSHEPIDYPYALNIHGHDHSGTKIHNHLNLAANVCGYVPVSLGDVIKSGKTKKVQTIHRMTIENATKRVKKRGSR